MKQSLRISDRHRKSCIGKLSDLIEIDPEKTGGALVLSGTQVPINQFFDYLRARDSLNVFLDDFHTVTREQALGVLE